MDQQRGNDDLEGLGDTWVIDNLASLFLGDLGAEGQCEAEFTEETAEPVDTLGAGEISLLPETVRLLHRLLLERVNWNRPDVVAAMGFQEGLNVSAVGLAPTSVGCGVLRRQ